MWPRSYLRGQPYEWVEVHGVQLQNTVGLCMSDHQSVTGDVGGHRAHIRYDPDTQTFSWWAKGTSRDDWFYVGLLDGQELALAEPEAKRIRKVEGLCPECGRPVVDPHDHRHKPGPKRKATTYSMVVPDDEEVGTDILDDWVDQFAALFGFGEASARLRRYHVTVLIFSWAMQNKDQLLQDLEEAEFFARD